MKKGSLFKLRGSAFPEISEKIEPRSINEFENRQGIQENNINAALPGIDASPRKWNEEEKKLLFGVKYLKRMKIL